MKSDLVSKLIENAGAGHIAETLSEMSGTILNSLLMEVFLQRVRELAPAAIEAQYKKNRLVTPCTVDQRALVKADTIAYRVLDPRFKGVELSPVIPLGINAVLGGVNQKNVLATIRNCEVLADPATALTLECVRQRRILLSSNPRSLELVRLATSARCMRLQRFDDIPGFVPHFKVFSLVTAGRDIGNRRFEIESMRDHVQFYLDYLSALQSDGYDIRDIHVELSDIRIMRAIIAYHGLSLAEIGRHVQARNSSVFMQYKIEWPRRVHSVKEIPLTLVEIYGIEKALMLLSKLEEEVVGPLRESHPSITFSIDLDRAAGMSYYTTSCFKIWASNESGIRYPLADGGFADWTQKILQSRKERFLASGMGTELILSNFK